MSTCIGLDIGGANLKIADRSGRAATLPFALWRQPEQLESTLNALIHDAPRDARIAVTMTGELCDCFATRAEGVDHIVAAVELASTPREVVYYQTSSQWVNAARARADWTLTAASNWHLLARFAARYLPGASGMMVDIGSTTTDIIPIENGWPATRGTTDWTRLKEAELLYTGVERTPVGGVLPVAVIPGDHSSVPLAQEWFATMRDVYLVLGDRVSDSSDRQTADGRPADVPHARARLARMLCAEVEELGGDLIDELARQAAAAQRDTISQALRHVMARNPALAGNWLICGTGAWLGERMVRAVDPRAQIQSLADLVSPDVSRAAPAWAAAQLAWELDPHAARTPAERPSR